MKPEVIIRKVRDKIFRHSTTFDTPQKLFEGYDTICEYLNGEAYSEQLDWDGDDIQKAWELACERRDFWYNVMQRMKEGIV